MFTSYLFFPFSSDDGFSITDYKKVRDDLGSWEDISLLSKDYRVMADIVINHASKKSEYFQEFVRGNNEYKDFFISLDKDEGFEGKTPNPCQFFLNLP